LTDDYFYAGWTCLDDDECEELVTLLHTLKDAAQKLADNS
jgi:hypothetical protein